MCVKTNALCVVEKTIIMSIASTRNAINLGNEKRFEIKMRPCLVLSRQTTNFALLMLKVHCYE